MFIFCLMKTGIDAQGMQSGFNDQDERRVTRVFKIPFGQLYSSRSHTVECVTEVMPTDMGNIDRFQTTTK